MHVNTHFGVCIHVGKCSYSVIGSVICDLIPSVAFTFLSMVMYVPIIE